MSGNKELFRRRREGKAKVVIIISTIVVIAAVIAAVSLRQAHLRQLRAELDAQLSASITHIERGNPELSLAEAMYAGDLAERLRDDDALAVVFSLTRLSQEISLGNEFIDLGQYQLAADTYSRALTDYAPNIDNLNSGFIERLIETAEMYIYFFELIELAEDYIRLAFSVSERIWGSDELDYYRMAMAIYEDAEFIAHELSFSEGERIAEAGISHMIELIDLYFFITDRMFEAAGFERVGDLIFEAGYYAKAIVFYRDALEIYRELRDTQSVLSVATAQDIDSGIHSLTEKLDLTERRLEEVALLERLDELSQLQDAALIRAQQDAALPAQHILPPDIPYDSAPGGTEAAPDMISLNYEHNRSIHFDLTTMIDDQNQSPANLIRMGTTPGLNEGWYNGCGWIAAYNALIILGSPMHPAEIVNHFEAGGGTVLGGVFGTFPHAIEGLFRDLGYNVNHTLFPARGFGLDNAIRGSRVSILAYTHSRAAHFIAIEYRESEGMFIIYNDSFARSRSASLGFDAMADVGSPIDSVTALIRETPHILFSFSLITIS